MNSMLPFLLMDSDSEDDSMLLMVLMNSMTGGLDSADGFGANFNLLLPMLLGGDDDDSEGDMDMLVIMMAMQSQAPGSAMGSNAMLPLMLMDSEGNNEDLIFFMMMMNNQQC